MQKERHDTTEQSVPNMLELFVVLRAVDTLEVERAAVVLMLAGMGESGARENGVGDGRQGRKGEDGDLAEGHGGEGVVDTALLGHGDGITS